MINWDKLKPYKSDKRKSLEMLYYCVVDRKYGKLGKLTPIDDTGGGDGVEFYLTFQNGEEWGWQVKFFGDTKRLKNGGRKKQIENSLKAAIEKHKKLTKWFLCTNSDFTTNEIDYFNNILKTKVQNCQNVKLEHWGESFLSSIFTDPKFEGINKYFFEELELNFEWFKNTFKKQFEISRNKFERKLYTNVGIESKINNILINQSFKNDLHSFIKNMYKGLENFSNKLDSVIKYPMLKIPIEGQSGFYDKLREKFANASSLLKQELKLLINKLDGYTITDIKNIKNSNLLKKNSQLISTIESFFNSKYHEIEINAKKIDLIQFRINFNSDKKESDKILSEFGDIKDEILNTAEILHNLGVFGDTWLSRLKEFNKIINNTYKNYINILSEAGRGKTNLACHICDQNIQNFLPAIYISGSKFINDNTLFEQLKSILDIPIIYSFEDFLNALDISGKVNNVKIPIIIDGLNESTSSSGKFSPIWKNDLSAFNNFLNEFDNIVLITTCRESYSEQIWDNNYSDFLKLYGFNQKETEEAVLKYFSEYKIKAEYTNRFLEYFQNPLYLRIFCESKNKEKKENINVLLSTESIFDIFEQYLIICNNEIIKRLDLPPSKIIINGLESAGRFLWENNKRHLSLNDFLKIFSEETGDWTKSKTKALLDESLIIDRDWKDSNEYIVFPYDLLAGFVIASYLLKKENFLFFLKSDEFKTKLLNSDRKNLHPLYDDILKCICALIPQKHKLFVHEILDDHQSFSYSIASLFEISPNLINEKVKKDIITLFAIETNIEYFLDKAAYLFLEPDHPLNIEFWSSRLYSLTMPIRDRYWSEFIRQSYELEPDTIIANLKNKSLSPKIKDPYTERKLHLQAKLVMWFLTSTNMELRDKATESLYYYGRIYTDELIQLVDYSFEINDPYISERMVAVLYGVCMARHTDTDDFKYKYLIEIANFLYNKMFSIEAKYYTTHILKREYAYRTIELALYYNKNIFNKKEIKEIFPPFNKRKAFEWRKIEINTKNEDNIEFPLHMDFKNYTIGHLVKKRQNYDFSNKEYDKVFKQILWRIYDLGYNVKLFKDIDKEIGSSNFNRNKEIKIERYGKKYSWIAYYEMAGYRNDRGLLKDIFEVPRTYEVNIDPSFPIKPAEFQLIKENFLGSNKSSSKEWVLKEDNDVNFKPYLYIKNLLNHKWILLDGYFNQEEKEISRYRFTFFRSLLINKIKYNKFRRRIENQHLGGKWLPEIPEDHHSFNGEIPWCSIFPKNEKTKIEFPIKKITKNVKEKIIFITKNNIKISESDEKSFWEEVREFAFKTGQILVAMDKKMFEKKLQEKNFKINYGSHVVNKEEFLNEKYNIEIPVIDAYSSANYNTLYNGGKVAIPSKEICECFNLHGRPQTFELFDETNQPATLNYEFKVKEWKNSQNFLFVRKDLLDKYLKVKNLKLIWAIWGEREFRPNDNNILEEAAIKGFAQKVFQQIIGYDEIEI